MTQVSPDKLTAPTFDSTGPEIGSGLSVARAEFWKGIPVLVTAKVQLAQDKGDEVRLPMIEYLRDLETVARLECDCRDTVQLIASGRRLLGDRIAVGLDKGRFSGIRVGPKLKINTRVPPPTPLQ